MAPIDVVTNLGKFIGYLIYLIIGVGFGMVLEMSGFGDSRKLAAQFYFKDMTVLKVMFTAIIVAMVLIFGFSAIGIMDFDSIFVTPTYLFPGIIGGLIMGVGFIIGGFCPGTSIVAVATLKIDGMFFASGVAFGVFVFGETVSVFQGFHNSSYMGRFVLPEFLGITTGLTVLFVVLMALTMFYWAEISEQFFGLKRSWKEINMIPSDKKKLFASTSLVFIALLVLFSGQPDPLDKWNQIKEKEMAKLDKREIYIHPYELLESMNDPMLYTKIFDFRNETDFNLFHLENSYRTRNEDIYNTGFIKKISAFPINTVIVVLSNNEEISTEAYKLLKGQRILNLYILEGGINNWLHYFPLDTSIAKRIEKKK